MQAADWLHGDLGNDMLREIGDESAEPLAGGQSTDPQWQRQDI
jgi:hypothetical protein